MKRFKDYFKEHIKEDDMRGFIPQAWFLEKIVDDLAEKVESLEYNMSTHEEITGGLLGDVEELEKKVEGLDTAVFMKENLGDVMEELSKEEHDCRYDCAGVDKEVVSQEIMKSTID